MTDGMPRLPIALADRYRIERERGLTAFPGLVTRARRFAGRPEGRSTSVVQDGSVRSAAQPPLQRHPRLAQRALLLATLGDRDSMYVLFERAIDARDPDAIWILNAAPMLRPLRHEPRYQDLLERMGLPENLRR